MGRSAQPAINLGKREGAGRAASSFVLRFNLAVAYAQTGQFALGLKEAEAALRIKPGDPEARRLHDLLEEQMGRKR